MINKTINGYTIRKLIGSGGMGDLYYAENRLGKQAAIKVLKKKFSEEPSVYERFINEAKIMVTLDHPNIRKVYDMGDINGQPAILMEYLNGETLREKIETGKKIPDLQLRKYFDQCVSALSYTHRKNVIHRDIKPSNIFITSDDEAKIVDFGIAKTFENVSHTLTGQTLGTILYMSPEQVVDPKRVTAKTDIYSLGVTFYHVLIGKAPYDATTGSEFTIQQKIVYEDFDFSLIPSHWRSLLVGCLRKKPEDRTELQANYFDGDTIVDELKSKQPLKIPKPDANTINYKPWLIAAVIGLLVMIGGRWLLNNFNNKPDIQAEMVDTTVVVVDTVTNIINTNVSTKKENNVNTEKSVVDNQNKEKNPEYRKSDSAALQEKKITPAQRAAAEIASTMIRIPGGKFMMGCTSDQGSDCNNYENPSHEVLLNSFYINKYEVTQEQWSAIMESNPSYYKNCDRCPVEQVHWEDARDFIRKLNILTGIWYRLPTEAEWEYAARGGQSNKYSGSNNLGSVAWYADNSGDKTNRVGQKSVNGYGLYDMSGNVWEWCNDWYEMYRSDSQTTPKGPSSGNTRVYRGGSWGSNSKRCQVSTRNFHAPTWRASDIGFRLAND